MVTPEQKPVPRTAPQKPKFGYGTIKQYEPPNSSQDAGGTLLNPSFNKDIQYKNSAKSAVFPRRMNSAMLRNRSALRTIPKKFGESKKPEIN